MKQLWIRLDAWFKENSGAVALASLLLLAFVLWNIRSVYEDEQNIHQQDCASARTRYVDVATFWSSKATTHGTHSSHEQDASALWNRIVSEVPKGSSAAFVSDISKVASTWQKLSDDDEREARLDSGYVAMLAHDFNKSCGAPPSLTP